MWPMLRRSRRILLASVAALLLALLAFLAGRIGGRPPDSEAGRATVPPSLSGRVLAASGGPPPSGTRVVVHGESGTREAPADDTGRFLLDSLPAGARTVEAVAGPLRARAAVREFAGKIRLPREFDAAGRVVESESGDPVAGAEVSCGQRRTRTDDRGRFRLVGVSAPDGRPPPIELVSARHRSLTWHPPAGAAWDDLFVRLLRR